MTMPATMMAATIQPITGTTDEPPAIAPAVPTPAAPAVPAPRVAAAVGAATATTGTRGKLIGVAGESIDGGIDGALPGPSAGPSVPATATPAPAPDMPPVMGRPWTAAAGRGLGRRLASASRIARLDSAAALS